MHLKGPSLLFTPLVRLYHSVWQVFSESEAKLFVVGISVCVGGVVEAGR